MSLDLLFAVFFFLPIAVPVFLLAAGISAARRAYAPARESFRVVNGGRR